MNLSFRHLFSRFLDADPDRLHFAAHSHHPWPDVTYEAHLRWWEDSARLMDDKWEPFFAEFLPRLRGRIGQLLGLGSGYGIAFAPNTHELVNRLVSAFPDPPTIVTTTSEFHSFARQSRRWEESGWAKVIRVDTEPFDTFVERFVETAADADLAYVSQVFFDSGFVVDLDQLIPDLPDSVTIAIDGYHGFMALPTDLGPFADRIFYLAGGYKYAMAGEGACFMQCPDSFTARPVDTGWYAGFGGLTIKSDDVGYGSGGDRFWGATQDGSGFYRLDAALAMLESEGISPGVVHEQADRLQKQFLVSAPEVGELIPAPDQPRGSFLTFRNPEAADIYERLHVAGVITDHRHDRWRIGFGIYQDPRDIERLLEVIPAAVGRPPQST